MGQIKEFFKNLFDHTSWPPRWHCGYWSDFHGWLYILSDFMIWAAYFTIPVIILNYVSKRKGIRFHTAYLYFAFFILACGLTHLLDATMFWIPLYRINALVRFFTACISWLTIYHLWKLLPIVSTIKTANDLEEEMKQKENLLNEVEKSNAELKKQNAFIENIFNATLDHMNVFDIKLNLISVNSVTEKFLNKLKHEIIGKNFTELFPNEIDQEYHQDLLNAAQGSVIMNKLSKSNANNYYETSFIPLFENNVQYAILVIARDITEKVKREKALKRLNEELNSKNDELLIANSELEHFSNILSHDLQEPLRKIQVYSQLFSEKAMDSVERNMFSKIIKSSDRMKNLIENALNYARTGRIEDKFENVMLDEVLSETLEDLELKILEKNAVITSDSLPEVSGIKYQLEQVFYNIIINSLKYNTRTPRIEISCKAVIKNEDEHDKHFFEISIRDNGIGFDEKYKNEIFSPFKRLQNKDDFEGTGIGLSLVKKIIEIHKWHVDAESQIGEGSVFKLLIPA
ncbi:MAG TPA: ATP-binding protein [Bacteroidia bacterium]|jgi:PAS domain S-box-containing protein|nr:ATP-binding protein [Bacteroidia bacterium]